MTKFQALFILYLRHESKCGGSWRWIAQKYTERYSKAIPFKLGLTFAGNQIEGVRLEQLAFNTLRPEGPLFMEPIDLFECDLTLLEANLKNNLT